MYNVIDKWNNTFVVACSKCQKIKIVAFVVLLLFLFVL